MVSLLKNQILKHLSSTFKGEGELTSLELDEMVLTDLLELPSWVRLTSAWCNKVSFFIHWTKLKHVPIRISLDEVKVEIETCEELRSLSAQQGLSSFGGTEYSFANKVLDGMTITVNVVSITFKTPAFIASVDIMRILVESKSPDWKKADLTKTRLKNKNKKQILIFKGLEWSDLRLVAKSTTDTELPPLRLITNRSRCKLTIKKRTTDCFVMGCKLLLILDDLLWVLTDSQLKAVLHFVESLSGLVQKANETTRIKKAARKLELLPEYHAQISQHARATEPTDQEQIFARCDVIETSYHLMARQIDLHLSDDSGAGRSIHPLLSNGSDVHLLVKSLQVDYYPYHLAAADRLHWGRYDQANSPHTQWLETAENAFKNSLLQLFENEERSRSSRSSRSSSTENIFEEETSLKKEIMNNMVKVMTSCIVLRIEDFTLFRVTTNEKHVPKEFIKGDKERPTPTDMSFHAEFTYYYYPGDIVFPIPPPKFYVHINPVVVNFHVTTILWLNSFALNLHQSLMSQKKENVPLDYIDVKIEAILPRLIFESNFEIQCGQRDRPKSLQMQVSRLSISNVRNSDGCSKADLAKCINSTQLGSLFFGSEFPIDTNDWPVIPEKFIQHVESKDGKTSEKSPERTKLRKTMLWTEARDIWCINLEPLSGDFYGARGVAHNRPVVFLDAFHFKLWVHYNPNSSSQGDTPDIHALASVSSLVSVQLNHFQLLFLLRLADEIAELVTLLELDSQRIDEKKNGGLVFGAIVPQIEVTLVMPSQTPGKESSGADLESVIPDSSSLADEIVTNPSIQWSSVLTTNLQDAETLPQTENVKPAPVMHANHAETGSITTVDSPKQSNSFLGFSTVKKGFSNFTTMIDSKLKMIPNEGSDSFSIRSDGSSDSDNVYLNVQGDTMFLFDGCEDIEYASEAIEEWEGDEHSGATGVTTPSENHSNASSYKRRDLISIATFKLGQVEIVQQSKGLHSVIKGQVSNLSIEECPAIPWDEFQSKFNTRYRSWTEVCDKPYVKPGIKLRKEHVVEKGDLSKWPEEKINTWFNDAITLALSNINVTLNASTISSLVEFCEDDVISQPMPFKMGLENIKVSVIEEHNIVGGEPVKINAIISKLNLARGKDGVIIIEPQTITPGPCTSNQEILDLKTENEQLRRRVITMERLNEENHRLRKCEEESQELRSMLHKAQNTLEIVLEEKQRLTKLLSNYQISKGDGKQQSSGKR